MTLTPKSTHVASQWVRVFFIEPEAASFVRLSLDSRGMKTKFGRV
jgi:hypothetical protein